MSCYLAYIDNNFYILTRGSFSERQVGGRVGIPNGTNQGRFLINIIKRKYFHNKRKKLKHIYTKSNAYVFL